MEQGEGGTGPADCGSEHCAPWRLHDLRRTVATRMAELGVQPHVVEAVLNHVSGHKAGVAGVYNRALYAAEKRRALELWGEHVRALAAGSQSDPDAPRPRGLSVCAAGMAAAIMSWARLGLAAENPVPHRAAAPPVCGSHQRRCGMWFTLPKCFVALDVAHIFCDANDHVGKEVVDVRSTS